MENEWRMDANLRAYFPSISSNRWLAVRLEFLGSVIILAAAIFAIISVTTGGGLSAGMVGLAVRGCIPGADNVLTLTLSRCHMHCKSPSH